MTTLALPSPQDLIDELDAILEQERRALVKGEIQRLEAFLERKEELIGQLNTLEHKTPEILGDLQDRLARNQALLGSAMQGIKAVANRMAELRRVRKGLEVYDRAGKKARFSTTGSLKLEKRA